MPTKKKVIQKTVVTIFPDGIITVQKSPLDDSGKSYVLSQDGLADRG